MFIDKEQREVLPYRELSHTPMKLSEAIRIGISILPPREQFAQRWSWKFCALGAAFAGVRGRQMTEREYSELVMMDSPCDGIAARIGFPVTVCADVSRMHYTGASAEECATWLESKGL